MRLFSSCLICSLALLVARTNVSTRFSSLQDFTLSTQSAASRAAMKTIRHVWTGPPPADLDDTWAVSPDGELLAFRDKHSHLALYRFASAEARQLAEAFPASQDRTRIIWSPDSARIAYNRNASAGRVELRVANRVDGAVRVVVERSSYVAPLAWSPDGGRVLVSFEHESIDELEWIDVSNGRAQSIKRLEGTHRNEWHAKAVLSGDGQQMVISKVVGAGRNRDLFVVNADGGGEASLVEHPADDYPVAWTSSNELLFVSDRAGQTDLWALPMGGPSKGIVRRLHRDLGLIRPLGLTSGGALYYAVNLSMTDVYTVALDERTGRIAGVPAPVAKRFVGNNSAPDLASDGSEIVYQVGLPGTGLDLVLQSLTTASERVIHPTLQQFSRPRFDPRGGAVVVHGVGRDGTQGVFSVNTATGKASLLYASPPSEFANPAWTRDGRRLFFERDDRGIWIFDRTTGRAVEVFALPESAANFTSAPSPDGAHLAVVHGDTLEVVDLTTRTRHELLRLHSPERLNDFPGALAWMPSGRHIVFGKISGDRRSLWRMSVADGDSEPLGIEAEGKNIYFLRVGADGKRLAFVMGDYDVRPLEVWVMENFVR